MGLLGAPSTLLPKAPHNSPPRPAVSLVIIRVVKGISGTCSTSGIDENFNSEKLEERNWLEDLSDDTRNNL